MARNIFYLFLFLILDKIDAAEGCLINNSFDAMSTRSDESVNSLAGILVSVAKVSSPLIYDDLRSVVEKLLNHCVPDEGIKNFFEDFIARLNNEAKTIEQQRILLNYISALIVQEQTFCEKVKIVETIFFVYRRMPDKKYFTTLLTFLTKNQNNQRLETIDWLKNEDKMRSDFFSRENQIFILERLKTARAAAIELSLIDVIEFAESQHFFKNPFLPTCEQLINLFIKKNSADFIMDSKAFFYFFSKLIGLCQIGENFDFIESALLSFSQSESDHDFCLVKIDEISDKTSSPPPTFAAYICAFAQIQKNDYTLFNELIEEIESPRRSHEDLPRLFCDMLRESNYSFDLQQYLSMFGVNLSQAMPKTETFLPSNPLSPPLKAAGKVIVSKRPQIKGDIHNGDQFSSVISNPQDTFCELPSSSGEERLDYTGREKKKIEKFKKEFEEYFRKKDAKRMSCCFCFLTNDQIVKKFIKRCTYLRLNPDEFVLFKEAIKDFLQTHAQ